MTHAQRAAVAERFWPNVRKSDACWEWQAAYFSGREYGLFKLDGRNMKAHRVAYMLERGPIKPGHVLLHECDNPRCVRPDHLQPGTHIENMLDMRRKGRSNFGEKQNKARITADIAHELRAAWQLGVTSRILGDLFGISRQAVTDVVRGRTWVSQT